MPGFSPTGCTAQARFALWENTKLIFQGRQMFKRLKNVLVDSFVGTIALGWIFAQGLKGLVDFLIEPATRWLTQRQYWVRTHSDSNPPVFPFPMAISYLLTSLFLILISYFLLRWLYYPTPEKHHQADMSETDQRA